MNANKPVTKTLIMKHIGMDDFSCPVYQDQFGRLWKDIDLGEQDTPCLYSVTNNDLDGEPCIRFARNIPSILHHFAEIDMNLNIGC